MLLLANIHGNCLLQLVAFVAVAMADQMQWVPYGNLQAYDFQQDQQVSYIKVQLVHYHGQVCWCFYHHEIVDWKEDYTRVAKGT